MVITFMMTSQKNNGYLITCDTLIITDNKIKVKGIMAQQEKVGAGGNRIELNQSWDKGRCCAGRELCASDKA